MLGKFWEGLDKKSSLNFKLKVTVGVNDDPQSRQATLRASAPQPPVAASQVIVPQVSNATPVKRQEYEKAPE